MLGVFDTQSIPTPSAATPINMNGLHVDQHINGFRIQQSDQSQYNKLDSQYQFPMRVIKNDNIMYHHNNNTQHRYPNAEMLGQNMLNQNIINHMNVNNVKMHGRGQNMVNIAASASASDQTYLSLPLSLSDVSQNSNHNLQTINNNNTCINIQPSALNLNELRCKSSGKPITFPYTHYKQ